jgi:hypothetical protein
MNVLKLIKNNIYPKKYKINNNSKSDKIESKTDKIESKTDKINSKSDKIESKTDSIEYKSDKIDYKTNKIDYKTDSIEYSNLSPNLIKYFNANIDITNKSYIDWIPPTAHGLSNSSIIIPEYYIRNNKTISSIDYFHIIIDDIRNLRKLNEYQLEYIKTLNDEDKHILFLELNKLFDTIELLLIR